MTEDQAWGISCGICFRQDPYRGLLNLKLLEIIQSVEVDSRGCYTRVSVCLNGQNPDSAVAISFLEK